MDTLSILFMKSFIPIITGRFVGRRDRKISCPLWPYEHICCQRVQTRPNPTFLAFHNLQIKNENVKPRERIKKKSRGHSFYFVYDDDMDLMIKTQDLFYVT